MTVCVPEPNLGDRIVELCRSLYGDQFTGYAPDLLALADLARELKRERDEAIGLARRDYSNDGIHIERRRNSMSTIYIVKEKRDGATPSLIEAKSRAEVYAYIYGHQYEEPIPATKNDLMALIGKIDGIERLNEPSGD